RATGRRERNMVGVPSSTLGGTAKEERQPDVEEELVPDLIRSTCRLRRPLGLLSVDDVAQLEAERHPAVEDEPHSETGLSTHGPRRRAARGVAVLRRLVLECDRATDQVHVEVSEPLREERDLPVERGPLEVERAEQLDLSRALA